MVRVQVIAMIPHVPHRLPSAGAVFTLLVSLLAVGCGGGDAPDASGIAVRDSAGIEIVEYPAEPPETEVIRVDGEPDLVIGREGDEDYELFRAREVHALASGNVVVTNGGTHELLFYGPDGSFVRRVGRRGEGPREWGFLSSARLLPGDTLVVNDPRRRRVTLWDSAGRFVRGESYVDRLAEVEPPTEMSMCFSPFLLARLANGALVTQSPTCYTLEARSGVREGRARVEIALEAGTTMVDSFQVGVLWEREGEQEPGERTAMIPFRWNILHAAAGDRLFIHASGWPQVREYAPRGALVRIHRERRRLRPAGGNAVRRTNGWVDSAGAGRPLPEDVPSAERLKPYERIFADAGGRLWLGWGRFAWDEGRSWTVLEPGAAGVHRVVVSPEVEVHAFRDGRLYALRTDPGLGVQQVVVHDLGDRW